MDAIRHTEHSLDTDVVRDALVGCAATLMGAERLRQVAPMGLDDIRATYQAVDAWLELIEAGEAPQLGGAENVGRRVDGARKGEVLEPDELLAIGRTLEVLGRVARRLLLADVEPLSDMAAGIEVDPGLTDELLSSFTPDGRLSGERYPELTELRRQIDSIHSNLRSTLDQMAKGPELADDLQDGFWTIRNDRYVLPLKPHAKNMGVVHGTSGSGKTVFVEPHAILELNNRLRLAEGALRAEERRILMALSREVGAESLAILDSIEILTQLDTIAARAALARRLGGRTVRVDDAGVVALSNARHPVLVLRGIDVVGHDLSLSSDRPALVLTGPNTGGKTVALKTIGLCAWMVQRALPLAVDEGRFDRFETLIADVGDAQTVTDDLSSFSAQLVTVHGMLEASGPGALLLLDELASGTDPTQGAALAQAVLEALVEGGSRVVTTTHYPALKGLATVDPRFAVAAMEVVDGAPTYHLIPDATGESHALATARRLGLPDTVLTRAEALWTERDSGVAQTLEGLAAERSALHEERRQLERLRKELAQTRAKLERQEAKVREGRRALEEEAAEAFRSRLDAASKAVGAVVAQLQKNPSHKGVNAARASLKAMEGLVPEPKPEAPPAPTDAQFEVGDRVRHRTLGAGEVVEAGKTLQVRFGAMQSVVRAEDLERLRRSRQPKAAPVVLPPAEPATEVVLPDALRIPGNTIDLRGKRVEEGLEHLDRGLADAVADGLRVVFVLHGHGTGAMKQAVRSGLRGHPHVERFAPANADQGGDAYTVVAVRA